MGLTIEGCDVGECAGGYEENMDECPLGPVCDAALSSEDGRRYCRQGVAREAIAITPVPEQQSTVVSS